MIDDKSDGTQVMAELADDGISRRQLFGRGAGIAGVAIGTGLLADLLAACGTGTGTGTGTGSGAAAGAIAPGGLLKVAIREEPDTLDPAKSPLSSAFEVFANLNASLVGIEPSGELVPVAAEKWSNPDPRTWVFDLRKSATFNNGDPLTPEDVKFTIERVLAKDTASPWAGNIEAVEKVTTEGDQRVVLHLKQPSSPILAGLTRISIQSQKAVETGDPARKPVGLGPFQFVEWVQGDHLTISRNPHWWGKGEPHLNEVTFRFMPTSPSVVTAVESGELDYTSSVPPNLVATVSQESQFNFTTSTTSGYPTMIGFNQKSAPLDNELFRQAIAWAIDRDEVHKVAYFAAGSPGSEEVGTGSPWYSDNDPYLQGPQLS
jgi:peptide/nickel transport system substrate-binding protein